MNQRFDPNDKRPIDPTTWPDDTAESRNQQTASGLDPAARPSMVDPLASTLARQPLEPGVHEASPARSKWPILIVLLAGVVLALLVWLPSEMAGDPNASDTATQPAPSSQTPTPSTDETVVPPASTMTAPGTPSVAPDAPAATPPATNEAAPQPNGMAPAN